MPVLLPQWGWATLNISFRVQLFCSATSLEGPSSDMHGEQVGDLGLIWLGLFLTSPECWTTVDERLDKFIFLRTRFDALSLEWT